MLQVLVFVAGHTCSCHLVCWKEMLQQV